MTVIQFAIKKAPVAPAGQWYSALSDTYWYPIGGGSYTGGQWEDIEFQLPTNGWYRGFRPTKIKITGTRSSTAQIIIADESQDVIGANTNITENEVIIDLSYGSSDKVDDIDTMTLINWNTITSIEFNATIPALTLPQPDAITFDTVGVNIQVFQNDMAVGKANADGQYAVARSDTYFKQGVSDTKLYFEFEVIDEYSNGGIHIGFCDYQHDGESPLGSQTWGIGIDLTSEELHHNGSTVALTGLGSWSQQDIVNVAVDLAANAIWIGRNFSWLLSGDPANGTNPVYQSAGLFDGFEARPAVSMYGIATGGFLMSQYDFMYSSPPDGFTALAEAGGAAYVP